MLLDLPQPFVGLHQGVDRSHVAHPKHLKEMAPQELSTHHPLAQATLLFSTMGYATEDGTALLVMRPAPG